MRAHLAASPPGFPKGLPFGHHVFGKKCEAFFVEHMQRASGSPEFAQVSTDRYACSTNSILIEYKSDTDRFSGGTL
jgi:hypothetical protein